MGSVGCQSRGAPEVPSGTTAGLPWARLPTSAPSASPNSAATGKLRHGAGIPREWWEGGCLHSQTEPDTDRFFQKPLPWDLCNPPGTCAGGRGTGSPGSPGSGDRCPLSGAEPPGCAPALSAPVLPVLPVRAERALGAGAGLPLAAATRGAAQRCHRCAVPTARGTPVPRQPNSQVPGFSTTQVPKCSGTYVPSAHLPSAQVSKVPSCSVLECSVPRCPIPSAALLLNPALTMLPHHPQDTFVSDRDFSKSLDNRSHLPSLPGAALLCANTHTGPGTLTPPVKRCLPSAILVPVSLGPVPQVPPTTFPAGAASLQHLLRGVLGCQAGCSHPVPSVWAGHAHTGKLQPAGSCTGTVTR